MANRVRFINLNEKLNTIYYISKGPVIIANDTEQTTVYKQSFSYDSSTGKWSGIFYIELIDHFGLDDNDLARYQVVDTGFTTWWVLQHLRNYKPLLTKIGFIVCLEGEINP